jgi:hypothetical protein
MIKILGGYLSILSFEIVSENHFATERTEKMSFSQRPLWQIGFRKSGLFI